jgi:transposase
MAVQRFKTWEITDEFWEKVKPLIPASLRTSDHKYKRKPGGGRKAVYNDKTYFAAIIYVLRTGIIWDAIPRSEYNNISPKSIHKKFMQWSRCGFFEKLWKAGVAEYDEMGGIAWEWQSADGTYTKAPMAQEAVGPNPTDRGKKRKQKAFARRRTWYPIINRRNRGKSE